MDGCAELVRTIATVRNRYDHPDLHITGWNHVEIGLWTHAVGGLSLNDFVLAREIDALDPA